LSLAAGAFIPLKVLRVVKGNLQLHFELFGHPVVIDESLQDHHEDLGEGIKAGSLDADRPFAADGTVKVRDVLI
jgi:hypothetical protein